MKTLITFLGRVPKTEGRYRTTRYHFGDGTAAEPAAFFGWPLAERIRPDRLVIMGTAGSMWDHLFEEDHDLGAVAEDDRLALVEAVERKAVTTAHLERLQPVLAERRGMDIQLVLIPYCRTPAEQTALLGLMAEQVQAKDEVHLDITHGYRTLPMLAVLAGLYLRQVRKAVIGGIWYGAYDPDTQEAPVQELSGLLHIAGWLEALAIYERSGDYGAFAPLLGAGGEQLRKAAFFERTSNPVKAREALTGWSSRPDRFPAGDPAAALFQQTLEDRLRWYRGATRSQWEQSLAREYLTHGDYVRATIFGLEAVISAEAERQGRKVDDFEARDAVRAGLKEMQNFRTLNSLRNALAHGLLPDDRNIRQAVSSDAALKIRLERLFQSLFTAGGNP